MNVPLSDGDIDAPAPMFNAMLPVRAHARVRVLLP